MRGVAHEQHERVGLALRLECRPDEVLAADEHGKDLGDAVMAERVCAVHAVPVQRELGSDGAEDEGHNRGPVLQQPRVVLVHEGHDEGQLQRGEGEADDREHPEPAKCLDLHAGAAVGGSSSASSLRVCA